MFLPFFKIVILVSFFLFNVGYILWNVHTAVVCLIVHFTKTYNLKVHEGVQGGELPYCCDGCNKIFSKAYSLKVHKDVHSGERPYCCDVLIKH